MRLKSISNIAKITKSMKMIASTKMTKAQRSMEVARVFGTSGRDVFDRAGTAPKPGKDLVIVCSSDSGLCGGIHSSVSKATKTFLREHPQASVVIIGEKAKPQIAREFRSNIKMHFSQVGKNMVNFAEASLIAEKILASGIPFEDIHIFYNQFKSVIAYEAASLPVFSETAILESPNLSLFETEDESFQQLAELSLANTLYWALTEAAASEMSARRTAMENATKNANDMIHRLTLTYNRTRQAAITNELVDIITGASAV